MQNQAGHRPPGSQIDGVRHYKQMRLDCSTRDLPNVGTRFLVMPARYRVCGQKSTRGVERGSEVTSLTARPVPSRSGDRVWRKAMLGSLPETEPQLSKELPLGTSLPVTTTPGAPTSFLWGRGNRLFNSDSESQLMPRRALGLKCIAEAKLPPHLLWGNVPKAAMGQTRRS